MKMEKLNLFKVVNVLMVVFCVGAAWLNHVGVDVVNSSAATSSVNGGNFEYLTSDDSFMFKKDGKLTGVIPTNKKFTFTNDNLLLNLNSNAIGVGIAAAAGAAVNVGETIGGAAIAGGAAMLELPGAAAVEATVAGAGVAASEAAAAAAASTATAGAALATIAAPVLIGVGVGILGA